MQFSGVVDGRGRWQFDSHLREIRGSFTVGRESTVDPHVKDQDCYPDCHRAPCCAALPAAFGGLLTTIVILLHRIILNYAPVGPREDIGTLHGQLDPPRSRILCPRQTGSVDYEGKPGPQLRMTR